jgi:beta-glucanase (GH16 family)
LWPKASVWPPEIDFNETGGEMNSTSSTVHFGATNLIDQRHVDVNMKKWHTWGVVWTPTSISYIVDGRVWGKVTSEFEIPNQPMTVDFEQRALCAIGRQCPTAPVSLQIDWVAEYAPK